MLQCDSGFSCLLQRFVDLDKIGYRERFHRDHLHIRLQLNTFSNVYQQDDHDRAKCGQASIL